MIKIIETETFSQWPDNLRNIQAKARIAIRIRNAAMGHFGDVKSVGDGVFEMRVHTGSAIVCILQNAENRWFCCWQAEIKIPKPKTLNMRSCYLNPWRMCHERNLARV